MLREAVRCGLLLSAKGICMQPALQSPDTASATPGVTKTIYWLKRLASYLRVKERAVADNSLSYHDEGYRLREIEQSDLVELVVHLAAQDTYLPLNWVTVATGTAPGDIEGGGTPQGDDSTQIAMRHGQRPTDNPTIGPGKPYAVRILNVQGPPQAPGDGNAIIDDATVEGAGRGAAESVVVLPIDTVNEALDAQYMSAQGSVPSTSYGYMATSAEEAPTGPGGPLLPGDISQPKHESLTWGWKTLDIMSVLPSFLLRSFSPKRMKQEQDVTR